MTDFSSPLWTGGDLPAAGLSWLLDSFATPFLKSIGGRWQDARERARWDDALRSYGQSIHRHYGRLRVLGKNEDVPLGEVFTDVFILDQISARRRFDIRELTEKPIERFDLPRYNSERRNGMGLVNQGQSLYILGKPGAGKTTFLKNVAVRAIANRLGSPTKARLPLFVPLHEWANSRHDELLPFLVAQLDTHHFPEAERFLAHLLENGSGLLLFDGLDEVRQERAQRAGIATQLRNFTRKYDKNQYLITCRVAASEYVFPGLRDVEMADFTREQVLQFAEKWFGAAEQKFASFAADLEKSENAGLAELCNVPLLLSLLCLYYDDAQSFPARRAELYEDALDALLRKWDSSRQIARDEIYRGLSHKRKQQMFAHIATPAFETGQLYWTTKQLADAIAAYLSHLPGAPPIDEIDGESVLRAIEAQHGVLVERAHNIHSFSHLSFQEYFTAKYIAENEARGATRALVENHLTDERWREVFLLTASLLDSGDDYLVKMRTVIDELVGNGWLAETLAWTDGKIRAIDRRKEIGWHAQLRLAYISLTRVRAGALDLDFTVAADLGLDFDSALAFDRAIALALAFDRALATTLATALELAHDFENGVNAAPRLARTPESKDSDLDIFQVFAPYRSLIHALSLERACAVALELDLALALNSAVGVDFALFYGWRMAIFVAENWRNRSERDHLRNSYRNDLPQLITFCERMKAENVAASLRHLALPHGNHDDADWRALAAGLWLILEEKQSFLQVHSISQKEEVPINHYLYANELLVRCLDLAYVTNRQEILDNLLRPPG